MSNQEKIRQTSEHNSGDRELESISAEQREALRETLEKAEHEHKHNKQESIQDARSEALSSASQAESLMAQNNDRSPAERRTGIISRRQRDQSFNKQMDSISPHLSKNEQSFSRFIHNKNIEKISDTAGSTIARPNALLAGSITAFILVTVVYLLAKHYGYQLSGFETIGAFALGWILGMIYDYIRLLIGTKKR